ncbi:hypothetical protein J6590_087825 [Homalodisca vitripennis]|nr:hypothetical protein J6590_087825 [Homalodisca vitripennis]
MLRAVGHFPACNSSDKYFAGLALAMISHAVVDRVLNVVTSPDSTTNNLARFASNTYLLSPVIFILHSYICRESYRSILADLSSVSDELKSESTRTQRILFSAFTAVQVVGAVAFQLEYGVLSRNVPWTIMHLAFTSPLLHYLVFTDLLTSKFSALNIRLENISTDVTTTPLQTISTQINSVFRLHTHLHVVVWDVNAHFCLYNLLSITTRLAVIVLEMYAYLMSISEGNDYRHHDYNGFVFMFSEVVFLVTQCLLCHACAKEANRTVMIAHHLLQPETPTRLWEEVGVFSRLTLNNKVSFSVGGIFNLDRPFLTKVAMTSLSYLIIAVQLKDVRLSGSDGPKTNGTGSGVENSTSYSNSIYSYT